MFFYKSALYRDAVFTHLLSACAMVLPTCVRNGQFDRYSMLIFHCSCSGLPSDRTNLSPFTKDFRGGGQVNEPIGNFLTALPLAGY